MQAVEATYGGVALGERVFAREGEEVAARMQDSIDGIKIEERQAAAEIESVGKYDPPMCLPNFFLVTTYWNWLSLKSQVGLCTVLPSAHLTS